VLYDAVLGGAGLVAQLEDLNVLAHVVDLARERSEMPANVALALTAVCGATLTSLHILALVVYVRRRLWRHYRPERFRSTQAEIWRRYQR